VRSRTPFTGRVTLDSDAVEGYRLSCKDCEEEGDRTDAPFGDRWLACALCLRELNRPPGWIGLDHVAPHHDEPFESWYPRVKEHLGGLPEELAREWIHRHWGASPFHRFPLIEATYELECWPTPEIMQVGYGQGGGGKPNYQIIEGEWLSDYMTKHLTWPTPIVVFENKSFEHWHPLQLLEGHRRLSFLHRLVEAAAPLEKHSVWVARIL
jgi:hypothetical protein